jgi:Sulfotransferase domain
MSLRAIGAGPPRTGTASLKAALERLLGQPCYHMREIPGHPFDLGDWHEVLDGCQPDWEAIYSGYAAAVDWPTSLFWRELSNCFPSAPVILSMRSDAQTWWESCAATILPYARMQGPEEYGGRNGLTALFQRFTGQPDWDDPQLLTSAYDAHVAAVRESIPPDRLVEWRPGDGWRPLCHALAVPVPDEPFPRLNSRAEWR